jgi:hypothetical protein
MMAHNTVFFINFRKGCVVRAAPARRWRGADVMPHRPRPQPVLPWAVAAGTNASRMTSTTLCAWFMPTSAGAARTLTWKGDAFYLATR